ncbi:hypothetical protein HanLR1_Chr02g0067661 [Helianthus annuus]|nr:hypothetical protein HanLR1_Chr02g0067661 [Helianthus annuus]
MNSVKAFQGNFYCSGCKYELKMLLWVASMKIYVFVYELKTLFRKLVYITFIFNDIYICVILKLL